MAEETKQSLIAEQDALYEALKYEVENIQGIMDGTDIPSVVIRDNGRAALAQGDSADTVMNPYYNGNGITLYCGNCLDVLPAISEVADMMATDPPYGVKWQGKTRRNSAAMFDVLHGDDGSLDVVDALAVALKRVKRCGHVYIFGKFDLTRLPLTQSCELIWDKEIISMGDLKQPWGSQHENITFATYEISQANRAAGYGNLAARVRKGSVIRVQRVQGGAVTRHPTEKPVLLMRHLIESSSVIGGLVLDPFAGSGSTLEAALLEGRRAIGIEIEEKYCEVAATRLSKSGEREGQDALAFA